MLNKSNKILFLIFFSIYFSTLFVKIAAQMPPDPNQYNPVQLSNAQLAQIANTNSQQPYSGGVSSDLRVFPFVVDPLIIIAMIALPTIGLLGLSSLIMPLIPIAIYLIQLFFPVGGSGRRRKREITDNMTHVSENKYYDKEIQHFVIHLSKAFDKYTN